MRQPNSLSHPLRGGVWLLDVIARFLSTFLEVFVVTFSQLWGTMKLENNTIRLAATDLSNHLSCRHLTTVELAVARGTKKIPLWKNPDSWVLQQRGLEHEQSYVEHLRAAGRSVVDLREIEVEGHAIAETAAAMERGIDVIVQATMHSGRWLGRADVLCRVDRSSKDKPSKLGEWSYEVYDCKLAQDTKAETILQLSLYSELLEAVQGVLPESMYVVRPVEGFVPEPYRVLDYAAYYRQVKSRLEEVVDRSTGRQATYPEPNAHCSVCRWWGECDKGWRKDDHLSLVAGITRLQQKQLALWQVGTVEKLAALPLPLQNRPERGSPESYVKVREQARVQVASREQATPVFELLPVEPERGLMQLPAPSSADLFFDIEGDPFVGTAGLEYLLGVASLDDDDGHPLYASRWAVAAFQEKAAFEWFIDLVLERWSANPGLHVYHFGAYEPSAIKRLMGRYASREDEVDRMLRASLFVDLHAVVKQAVRAGVEEYSLKSLEPVYSFTREIALREARFAKRVVEHCLELSRPLDDQQTSAKTLEAYNRDDCISTLALRNWLEQQRNAVIQSGIDVPRPQPKDGAPPAAVGERQQRVAVLFEALTRDIPVEPRERSEQQAACWLMANLLDWHRREDKAGWWEFFRLKEMSDEDLLYEKTAIAGLQFKQRLSAEKNKPVDRYAFPQQETSIHAGNAAQDREQEIGDVEEVNLFARTIDIRKKKKTADTHPGSIFVYEQMNSTTLKESLFRLGTWIQANGSDASGPYRAARDLLLRRRPRIRGSAGGTLAGQEENTLDAARRIAVSLDSSILAVQGPPGSGKTYTGARMICELIRQGKKVGITALSHKVIRNLLEETIRAAKEMGLADLRCVQKVNDRSEVAPACLQEVQDNAEALKALQVEDAQVLAGTAWLWSRQEFFEAVDVLFVDEAGQMSLANVLAVAQATKNVVLLGDPQQLEQPLKGSHPEGAEASALDHVLAGSKTIAADKGLFLDQTWRLHPKICSFTSELFYEQRLASRPGLDRQEVRGHEWLGGRGLLFVPVEHEGNQSTCLEEAERVAEIVRSLLRPQVMWVDKDENQRRFKLDDIVIVTPYNAQVAEIANRMPGARVGTVDKFQGQEAPVVIYSLTTSSSDEAPHGMEFLFSLNRLNVATSRARALCIVVGSRQLLEPECRTPRQMQLANALCRYLEMADVAAPAIRANLLAASS